MQIIIDRNENVVPVDNPECLAVRSPDGNPDISNSGHSVCEEDSAGEASPSDRALAVAM
ncbi:hypothetical protein [Streptomyces sp. NPDC056464]|uniref:hypothetical protein n=1 Tax=Streptomyces sp. NPDC056464 TaxID=3345828 RepID=UPI00368BB6F4